MPIRFPSEGQSSEDILEQMKRARFQDGDWLNGRVFSLAYYPGDENYQLLQDAFNLFFSENGLNPTTFPSLRKFETEVVSMVTNLMNGDENVAGSFTSGGTESILASLKAARDYAEIKYPHIKQPEVILPSTVHPAFNKACHYLKLKPVIVSVEKSFTVLVEKVKYSINKNTILIVASAPSYPHGILDPIEAIGALAEDNHLLFHVDACIGGFMLPFLQRLGYSIPNFDFRVKGVTSMSVDIHKYGYGAKGASVVLYKDKELRKKQFYVYSEWPGGIYGSPAVLGTRSGGAIAAAWALINRLGLEGYETLARSSMDTALKVQSAINNIPELFIIGNPVMSIFAFGSDEIDIYAVGDELSIKGWYVDRQQYPACLHLTVHNGHAPYIDEFIQDLTDAVEKVKKGKIRSWSRQFLKFLVRNASKNLPESWVSSLTSLGNSIGGNEVIPKRSAAMYGMMGELSNRDDVHEMVLHFLDRLQSVDGKSK